MQEGIQCSADKPCTAVQLLVQSLQSTKQEVEELRQEVKELTIAMRDRLPPWVLGVGTAAGVLIGALGGVLGAVIGK